MTRLFDQQVAAAITARINKLTPSSQRQWGKMDVAQMLAHCSNALESTLGDRPDRQTLMGKVFGKIAKRSILADKPIKKDLPTAPSFLVTGKKEFESERQRLLALVARMAQANPAELTKMEHPFFGKQTGEEWLALTQKHLNHHLLQFGV